MILALASAEGRGCGRLGLVVLERSSRPGMGRLGLVSTEAVLGNGVGPDAGEVTVGRS
jgi:hypothetical protein